MTSSLERVVRPGFENRVPRSPDEFATAWRSSSNYAKLQQEILEFDAAYPVGGESLQKFKASRRAQQSKYARAQSAYTLSYAGQVRLCLQRGFERLRSDPTLTITQLFGNIIMGLVVSRFVPSHLFVKSTADLETSVFYNLQPTTNSFFSRGALLFFAILLNAFGSALEILTLYGEFFPLFILEHVLNADSTSPSQPNVLLLKSNLATPFIIRPQKPSRPCLLICPIRS